jgi:hypothetical protein
MCLPIINKVRERHPERREGTIEMFSVLPKVASSTLAQSS